MYRKEVRNAVDIEFARGDSFSQGFQLVVKQSGEPVVEEFDEVYFTVKRKYTDKDFVMQKTLTGGGITSDGNGHYTLTLLPADTETMPFGTYDFDLEFDIGGDFVKTFSGTITLLKEITHIANKG